MLANPCKEKMKIVKLFLVLIIVSCGSPREDFPRSDAALSNVASTAYEFPKLIIPETFKYDSILVYDSVSQAVYHAHFFQSLLPGMNIFNNKMMESIKERIRFEQSYVDPCEGYNCEYTFNLKPTAFYSNDDVISITHVVDTYGSGGNHHNYSWFTVNFDLRRNTVLYFRDVFNLPSVKDSTDFVGSIRNNSIMEDCMELNVPFDSIDFSFTDNGIYINPDLSWSCSQNRSLLLFDSLPEYLTSAFKGKATLSRNKLDRP